MLGKHAALGAVGLTLLLASCAAVTVPKPGDTFECPTAAAPPFYVIVGFVEDFAPGHRAALVTIDDPALPLFRGLNATAIDAAVLVRACPAKATRRPLSPDFQAAVEAWRTGVASGSAGLSIQPPQQSYALREVPPPPLSGRLYAPGERRWAVWSFCAPDQRGCLRKP